MFGIIKTTTMESLNGILDSTNSIKTWALRIDDIKHKIDTQISNCKARNLD